MTEFQRCADLESLDVSMGMGRAEGGQSQAKRSKEGSANLEPKPSSRLHLDLVTR